MTEYLKELTNFSFSHKFKPNNMIVAQSRKALCLAVLLAMTCVFSSGVAARPEMHRYD